MAIISLPDTDDIECPCGNNTRADGFFPCDTAGNPMEPLVDSDWNRLYACPVCSRVYKLGKPTYNHAFTLGFAVPTSEYEDWLDCLKYEKSKVVHALLRRIFHLEKNNAEFLEAIEGFDTYQE